MSQSNQHRGEQYRTSLGIRYYAARRPAQMDTPAAALNAVLVFRACSDKSPKGQNNSDGKVVLGLQIPHDNMFFVEIVHIQSALRP